MDQDVGNLVRGDILIEGDTIAAIAPTIGAADAEVIDARAFVRPSRQPLTPDAGDVIPQSRQALEIAADAKVGMHSAP